MVEIGESQLRACFACAGHIFLDNDRGSIEREDEKGTLKVGDQARETMKTSMKEMVRSMV